MYNETGDSKSICNWEVEICILHEINRKITDINNENNSLGDIIRDDTTLPYLKRSLNLLNPWLIHLNSDPNSNQMCSLLYQLFRTEQNMAVIAVRRNQLDLAEGHCHRCLTYSRGIKGEGEGKTNWMCVALHLYVGLREHQMDYSGAAIFAEEAYNLLAIFYNPVHPEVQKAAGVLIHILLAKGSLYDASRFAQMTYENLKDRRNGMDQEGEEVGFGTYNLADVIYRQNGDLIKAEELARESLRIRLKLYGSNHPKVGASCLLVAKILESQKNFGEETKELLFRSLAISTKNEGSNGENVAIINSCIGTYYYQLADLASTFDTKQKLLLLAKFHHEEELRIELKLYGPNNPKCVKSSSQLLALSRLLSP
jgi:hypothetical protein